VLLVFGFIISFDVPALHPSHSQLDLTDLCGSRAFSCFCVAKSPPPRCLFGCFPLVFSGYFRGGFAKHSGFFCAKVVLAFLSGRSTVGLNSQKVNLNLFTYLPTYLTYWRWATLFNVIPWPTTGDELR
jgi:hypothetical protein